MQERFWSAKETNKKTSFCSTISDWYSSSQTAQNANAWHLLYTREPLWDTPEQLPQHILPSTKPPEQMLLEQNTFPAGEKSSCSLLCPHTPPLATGTIPTTQGSCSPAGSSTCMGAQRSHRLWPTCHGWNPSGRDEMIIHCKGCYGRRFAPAWQCRCPACPRGASSGSSDWAHQCRSWLQVALGSFLCNVQPKSQWFIPSNIWLQPTIILPHDGKCLFFPWNGSALPKQKTPHAHKPKTLCQFLPPLQD